MLILRSKMYRDGGNNLESDQLHAMVQLLVGKPLRYAIKSPDIDLFDLGFGCDVHFINANGEQQEACQHTIHLVCGILVYWKDRHKEQFFGDTSPHIFQESIQKLVGEKVRRVALSDKNDLWFDLGQCHFVIVTLENNEESWRLFSPGSDCPHLVASDTALHIE